MTACRPIAYAQQNIFFMNPGNFVVGQYPPCKSLILFIKNIACENGKLLKPASVLALRLVNRGLSTTLSTVAVDI
jgi:hypothetical protein